MGMVRRYSFNLSLPALLAALVLSACGVPRPIATAPPQLHSPQALDVFTAGYRGIADKYIEAVDIETIAMEGIKGFATIEPALIAMQDDKMVRLNLSGKEIVALPYPRIATASGWARLTVDLATAARAHSKDMHDASAEKLYEAVFDGALSKLDVFSHYASASEASRNRARRDGFGGIGIRFNMKMGIAKITQVMVDMPAAKAGLKVGDQINKIDGKLIGKESKDLAAQLRGPTNSEVRVTVFRASEERSFEVVIEREHIVPSTVTSRLEDRVLYLGISTFNQGTARSIGKEIERGKAETKDGILGVILDLRGNPGGLLKQSIKVADMMLKHGQILTTRGRHPDSLHHYEAGGRDLADGLPVVVIVDGKSASASEIVAAALQDRDRAVVIGTSSFGKGSVQTVLRLPNNGEITLTWSRFMAPSGYALHGLGVRPTICTSKITKGLRPVIEKALEQRLKTRLTFALWRTPGVQDEQKRKALRDTCPSERRKAYADIRIAKYLANDRTLFVRALDISTTTAQAHN